MRDLGRPTLFAGKALPFHLLEPKEWESFVYSTMEHLAPKRGALVEGGPTNATDDGFDTWLRRTRDGALICVQCKRLEASLGVPLVARELAKIGMRSALDRSNVREHYFVTTGRVTRDLNRLRREEGWATLRRHAVNAAASSPELLGSRKSCEEAGLDVARIVDDYVKQLDSLLVWSGREYEDQLTSVWSKLTETLERHFALETVIREKPRPDFDAAAHLQRLGDEDYGDFLQLGVGSGALPDGIRVDAGDNPFDGFPRRAAPEPQRLESDNEVSVPTTATQMVLATEAKTCDLLVAPGGGGKSTVARMACCEAARQRFRDPESRVPVLLPLGGYRGDLSSLVHRALRITSGDWTSLGTGFLIVADGLDEVPPEYLQALADELDNVLSRLDAALVLTLRDVGLRRPVVLKNANRCFHLMRLSVRQIQTYAEAKLGADLGAQFIRELRPRLGDLGARIFSLPFGAAAALHSFREHRRLPSSFTELLASVVDARIERNEARAMALPESLRQSPVTLVRKLACELAFECRVVRQRASMNRSEGEAAVANALARLDKDGVFGASALTDVDAWTLSAHHEFLVVENGVVSVGHDLVSDYLAGEVLARRWRAHEEHLRSVIGQDAWVFAARKLNRSDAPDFFDSVVGVDLLLAARCAVEYGKDGVARVEPHVLASIDAPDPFAIASGIAAATVLRTDSVVSKLRRCVSQGSPFQRERAMQALAGIGDRSVAREILKAADRIGSGPFNAKGGEISTWHRVPPNVAVALAREQLQATTPESLVAVSLETIQALGDHSDCDLVERVLRITSHLKVYYRAVYCLDELAPERARAILAERVGSEVNPGNLWDAHLLHAIGGSVAVSKESLTDLMSDASLEPSERFERIRLLGQLPLTELARIELRRMFDEGLQDRAELWQLATAQKVEEFDSLAWSALEASGTDDCGHAARFASERGWDPGVLTRFAERALVRAREIALDANANRWHFDQLLEVVLKAGLTTPAAELLSELLPVWISRHRELTRRVRLRRRTENPRRERPTTEDAYLERGLPHLATQIFEVADQLPTSVLRDCVYLNIANVTETVRAAYGGILAFLDPDDLDDQLESIPEFDERLSALALAAAHCGPTKRRRDMLESLIPKCFGIPYLDSSMADALAALWEESTLRVLAETIAAWDGDPPYTLQLASSTTGIVIPRLSPDLVEAAVAPAVRLAETGAARELLELWCGIGRRAQLAASSA